MKEERKKESKREPTKKFEIPKQTGQSHEDATLTVGMFCLAQCIIELLAVERIVPSISDAFRGFTYLSVAVNFFTAYLSAGSTLPSKCKAALIGYTLYTMHTIISLFLAND